MLTVENIILPPPAPGEFLNWQKVFGDDRPVELEIGSGKGGFLLERAKTHPDRGFLGLEWANQFFKFTADRMARWEMTNVRLMRADGGHLVTHHVLGESISLLHIYHPDPWPKNRHHKKRLIQPEFVKAVAYILVPGGRMAIQTDHADYFEQIQQVVGQEPRLTPVAFDVPGVGVAEGRVGTNFETKYLREGRPIYQLAVQKLPGGSCPNT
jgi:tRNA (guanine-N7-)-methyltransferase